MNFGVQTFTVREMQKKSLRGAYLPLAELGIKSLEVARIDFTSKRAEQLRAVASELGITVTSIQVKPKYVFQSPERIIEFCKITGCKNVVISMLPFKCILGSEKSFYSFVDSLDGMCDVYAASGITLAYHHHNWEYIRLSNGKSRMEELLQRTKKIKFVNDTYWTARCGTDPAHQIKNFGDRLLGIHLRDLSFKKRGLSVIPHDAAVGDGVIDFSAVLGAAEEVACSYCVIEQNSKSPYRDIEKSFGYLSALRSHTDNKE